MNEEKEIMCSLIKEELHIKFKRNVDDCDDEVVLLNHDHDFASIPNDLWIGDTGASCHMTNSLDGMINLRDYSSNVTVGSGEN